MAKALRTIAMVAGAVALVATGVGAFAGAAFAASSLGATVASIATYASLASGIAGIAAAATAKRPSAQGSITMIAIAALAGTPCLLGETYYGGVMRHDVGYGGKVGKVQNPYRGMVVDYSGCGPVEALVGHYANFLPVNFAGNAATGYYAGFLYRDAQLGASPEASALTPNWPSMPGWTASHKLSGKAAILWGLKFDKDGQIFSSGVPQLGAVWKGVKCYDPRLDSTFPGGSGAHRIDDQGTWEYTENPALHAIAYCYGRYVGSRKIFGIGLSADAIDIATIVAWANVCEANGWKVSGPIFEPGDRWANLKRIMLAGSAEPIFAGAVLSVKFDAPRVSLVTVTPADFADDSRRTKGMQSWRDRFNTVVPKHVDPANKWEVLEHGEVSDAGYLAEDGEEKVDTHLVELCKDKDQGAELAAYRLVNSREMFPIERTLKPEFRFFRPGNMVTIDDPEGGLDNQDCIIVRKRVDPQTLSVTWILVSETAAKHDFALGRTGTAPPTPTLLDPADRDEAAAVNSVTGASKRIRSQDVPYPISATDTTINIVPFNAVLDDGSSISFPADSIAGLASGTILGVFFNLLTGDYDLSLPPSAAHMASPDHIFLQWQATSTSGSYPTPDPPPGGGSSGPIYDSTYL